MWEYTTPTGGHYAAWKVSSKAPSGVMSPESVPLLRFHVWTTRFCDDDGDLYSFCLLLFCCWGSMYRLVSTCRWICKIIFVSYHAVILTDYSDAWKANMAELDEVLKELNISVKVLAGLNGRRISIYTMADRTTVSELLEKLQGASNRLEKIIQQFEGLLKSW